MPMQDPTAQAMRKFLRADPYVREFEDPTFAIEEAIYWFANDYHGGQASDLYAALCASEYSPGPIAQGPSDPFMYDMLVEAYAE
jgi:hypothetical protein